MKTRLNFWLYLAQFFLDGEMFQTNFVEKIETHILCSITFFFSKIVPFMRECGKNIVKPGRSTKDNMAYAHRMLGT